ncbi:MAG: hypothetical protein R3A45_07400 [Bdellovibrionota bacterium]|nr:hypothetical protein [Deltaproteobacteria bacterium]
MRLFITGILFVFCTLPVMANTEMAKETLNQTTTNPFCSAGYDGPNPYEKSTYEKPDPSKSICEGKDVVKCYQEMYKNR